MKHNVLKKILIGMMSIMLLTSCSDKSGPTTEDEVIKNHEANRL